MTAEPMVSITPKISVPRSRFLEWYNGQRPLAGQDALVYFGEGVRCGLYSQEEAAQLLKRHLYLERRENSADDDPEIPAEIREWLISRGWQPPQGGQP